MLTFKAWFKLIYYKYTFPNYFRFWEEALTESYDCASQLTYFHWFPDHSITDYVNGKYLDLYEEFNKL